MLEENAKTNVTNGNDEANGSSLSKKTRDVQKRKRNLKYKEDKKRKNSITQDKSGAESSSEGYELKI